MSAGRPTGATIDATGFNFMRLYIQMNSGATNHTMHIDDIRFV